MIVADGRPGMGKTGVALGIGLAAARAGHPVLYASLEMSAEQLGKRALSIFTGISHHLMQTGKIEQRDFQAVYKASQRLKDMPLPHRRCRGPDARLHRAQRPPAAPPGLP